MSLESEINQKAKEIQTDQYPISIGEIINIYENKELDIHPQFQRYFRWNERQKSKFIESILLGIPIPPIFVAQRKDGIWDVVDGLQRLSTIFEFVGKLIDEDGNIRPKSCLLKTEYLPSLENKYWESDDERYSFPDSIKIDFKRKKLNFVIVKKESDEEVKFDIFQRLNTLGSQLSNQEIRNCLLIMIDPGFNDWLRDLANHQSFLDSIQLSERYLKEQFNMELALRFFVYKNVSIEEILKPEDVDGLLTEQMKKFSSDPTFNRGEEERIFKATFDIIIDVLGSDTFKKYFPTERRFKGQFLISAFEVVAIGIGKNIDYWQEKEIIERNDILSKKIKSIWSDSTFTSNSGSGSNVSSRLPTLLPFGMRLFKNGD